MCMISLERFKELLGKDAADLTIEEVERIRDLEYIIADALFEKWLNQRTQIIKTKLENSDIQESDS